MSNDKQVIAILEKTIRLLEKNADVWKDIVSEQNRLIASLEARIVRLESDAP